MKSRLVTTALLLTVNAAQASPNILCEYFFSGGHWITFPTFTPGADGNEGSLGTLGTINTSTSSGTDAVCSRVITKGPNGHNLIQQVAYRIDPDDQGTPPDAGTCAFKGTKPFKVLSSKQIKTSAGQAHLVATASLQLADYTPTAKDLSSWEHLTDEAATVAMTKMCVGFVKGSVSLPDPKMAPELVVPAIDVQ